MGRPHEYASISWISMDEASQFINPFLIQSGYSGQVQIVSFFAEWCPNCVYEVSAVQYLYNEYHSHGLEMTLVMDYSPKNNSDHFVQTHAISIPVQYGELDEKDEAKRSETSLYKFRKSMGDQRGWGVPTHLIVEKEGNIMGVVLGEIIQDEIRPYLNTKLTI